MDWRHPGVAQLAATARSLDDEALAALANKGLVRRARKELESETPRLLVEGDLAFIETGGHRVTLAPIPAQCRCNCPATNVCRHILAALIFLRGSAPAAESGPSPRREILALTAETIEAWAGKALYRAAVQAIGDGLPIETAGNGTLAIAMPTRSVVCRWVGGAGLDGMLCSCHADPPCEHRVAALLGFLAQEGRFTAPVNETALQASAGAARTREEVLASAGTLLRELVALGIPRLSSSTVERLRTLSISAQAVDLPRLQRLLAALASEVALHVTRDAQASAAGLLEQAARIEALRCALAQARPEHVGRHRARYVQVGDCELCGAGARQWRTRSGYTGLTLYFWEAATRRWNTWTDARPSGTPGFSPLRAYHGGGPWSGGCTPYEACRSQIRLSGAWRSPAGRLSGRASTTAALVGRTDTGRLPAIEDWQDLRGHVVALFGSGLGEFDEQREIVVLRPAGWLPPEYDESRQRLTRSVMDAKGRALPLMLAYSEDTRGAIGVVERYEPAPGAMVLGLLRIVDGVLAVEPVSLIESGRVLGVTLADRSKGAAPPGVPAETEDWSADEPEIRGALPSAAAQSIGQALSAMEQLAEVGIAAAVEGFADCADRCGALFLNACATRLRSLDAKLTRARRESTAASRDEAALELLRAYYVVSLARRLDIVEGALAPLGD